jgi:hypothetical protein
MTIDDMIRLAHEAGWQYADGDDGYDPLWEFGQLVSAAEREAIAKIADGWPDYNVQGLAEAIRARGQG